MKSDNIIIAAIILILFLMIAASCQPNNKSDVEKREKIYSPGDYVVKPRMFQNDSLYAVYQLVGVYTKLDTGSFWVIRGGYGTRSKADSVRDELARQYAQFEQAKYKRLQTINDTERR